MGLKVLLSNIKKSVEKGVSPLVVTEPLLMSEWADRFFYLSEESSSSSGKWETLPYQKALLNWFGNDDIEVIDCMKAARLGYTKCVLAAVGYFTEHKHRNIVIYQPSDSDASDFVKDEIDPMIRDVSVVGDMLRCEPGAKSKHNTNEKKTFLHSILDIKGAKAAKNFRRMTKDIVIYEELDGMDQDIEKEGSPLTLGDTRVETSSFPKSIRGTTPKTKGLSHIEGSIEQADLVFMRYLPCPHCGYLDFLKWKNVEFNKANLTEAVIRCEECDDVYTYGDYAEMDQAGQWRTEHGQYYDDQTDLFHDFNGDVIPPPRHLGLKIWSGYSYFSSWTKIASEFLKADAKKKEGDHTLMKTFINTKLGETYQEQGEQIDDSIFDDERLEEWAPDAIPKDVLCLTMSVDVQGGKNARLEFEIVGWGMDEESWSIAYEKIHGNPEKQEVWDHIDAYRKMYFTREDGLPLKVRCTTVDSGYKANAVYKYTTKRQGQRVYATKGHSQIGKPLVGKPSLQGPNKETKLYMVGTDTAKETLFDRLQFDDWGPGYCHFPKDRDPKYFEQLTAEEKKTFFVKGEKKVRFVKKKNSARNEAIDLRVGNMVALKLLNPNMKILKRRQHQILEKMQEAEAEKEEATTEKPVKKKKIKGRIKRSFVNGWR